MIELKDKKSTEVPSASEISDDSSEFGLVDDGDVSVDTGGLPHIRYEHGSVGNRHADVANIDSHDYESYESEVYKHHQLSRYNLLYVFIYVGIYGYQ